MDSEIANSYIGHVESPVGKLTIVSDGDFLTSIHFSGNELVVQENPDRIVLDCIIQLEEYFSGSRKSFDLALNPKGTTFQKKVWDKVIAIPYGETISYGEIAKSLGDFKLNRAVGLANGANPIPIIIPCHRVVGSNGRLVGYAGGLERKKNLLNHEQNFHSTQVGQLKLF